MASPLELSSVFSKKFLSTVNITNYPDLANFLVLTKKFVKSVVYCSSGSPSSVERDMTVCVSPLFGAHCSS